MLYFFVQVFRVSSNSPISPVHQSVSVIICAKNEADNLQRHLPAILAQRYANDAGITMFQVIVVDDASWDDTANVLKQLQQQYAHLDVVTIAADEQRTFPGKKYALSRGIVAATYEDIVVTDADCAPASDLWLQKMVAPLQHGKLLTAGYGRYASAPGLLNAFIRWETLHTFLQYSTYAMVGRPYMATGRNLAYKKEAFLKAQTSPEWSKLPSGDDDLLINTVADAHNIEIVADKDAFTISDAKASWRDWATQKQRHLSTGKYYRPFTKLLLGGYAMSHAALWFSFFVLLFKGAYQPVIGVMLCRCFIYWAIWYKAAKQLNEKELSIWFPLMDIGWMLYNFAFTPYIFWKNKKQWK